LTELIALHRILTIFGRATHPKRPISALWAGAIPAEHARSETTKTSIVEEIGSRARLSSLTHDDLERMSAEMQDSSV